MALSAQPKVLCFFVAQADSGIEFHTFSLSFRAP
jgi:hypothetical protein